MGKIGFWQSLLGDVGYFEREAINSNHESMQMLMDASMESDAHFTRQLRKLFELDHAQSKELAQLRVMVRVMAETLVDMGFDKERLEQRMEAALDRLESEETMKTGNAAPEGGPYRGGPSAEAAKPEPKTTCVRCTQVVLARRTNITENGAVCDRCYYA